MRIYRIAAQSDQDFWLQLEQHQDESDRAILEKPIRLYNRKLKVANVGGLQTMFDTSRSAWVARWLLKTDPQLQAARYLTQSWSNSVDLPILILIVLIFITTTHSPNLLKILLLILVSRK
jgi:hypothetical protein